jgi:uncharacterized protein involved in outer membrane biogenesis
MRWKWILLIAGGLVVALVVAVIVIVSTYDFNKFKPMIIQKAKEETGRELKLEGDIRLKIGLTPALVVDGVSFQNAPWGSRPEMAKIKRFEVQVALLPLISGNVELKRLILVEPDILIETDKTGKSNLEFEVRKKEIPEKPEEKAPPEGEVKLPALAVDEFRIVKGSLVYRDGKSGKTHAVTLENLSATFAGIEAPLKLNLKGVYNSEPFEMEGTLGPLKALTDPKIAWPLNLKAKALETTVTVDGNIKDVPNHRGIELGFAVKGKDLATLQKVTGKPTPVKGPFDISGRLTDPSPKAYKISDLKVTLGESDLGGTVEVSLAGARPKMSASLSSKKLDVRPMMGETSEKGKTAEKPAKASPKREKVFPSDPLPLDAMKQVDAKVKFQAGQVLTPNLSLHDVSVDMSLENGHLVVKPVKGVVGQGTLEGQIDLNAQASVAALGAVMKISQLDVGRMLKELGISDAVEGRLDGDIDLKGQGASIAALMAGLNGKTVLVMGKGKMDNKYIDLISGDLSSGIFSMLGLKREDAQQITVNCFVSGFAIKNGIAETTGFVLDTDRMSVIADGQIDLRTEKLNLGFRPYAKEGAGTSATGKVSLGLSELAKAFKLTGTLANPSLGIDTTQAALTAGKIVGGTMAFGPAGIAAALAGTSPSDPNPCLTALEAARKGVKPSGAQQTEKKENTSPQPADSLKDIEKGLQKLFGR